MHPNGTGAATPVKGQRKQARQWLAPALESASTTRCGSYHNVNQDCCLVLQGRFYGVADGVGGGAFGEVASRVLLDYCVKAADIRDPKSLCNHVRSADAAVQSAIERRSPGAAGAATLVCAWLQGHRGHLVHVGDARASRLRFQGGKATLETLTVDQTYGNLGEHPPPGGSYDDPARMVGVGATGDPPATPLQLNVGDILLLCSDGLHRYADPADIVHLAEDWQASQLPLQALAERLETLALGGGSPDDITILLVRRNHWLTLPKRMMAWMIGAACLSLVLGLGIAVEKLMSQAQDSKYSVREPRKPNTNPITQAKTACPKLRYVPELQPSQETAMLSDMALRLENEPMQPPEPAFAGQYCHPHLATTRQPIR